MDNVANLTNDAEWIISRRRGSAFAGTPLDVMLRELDVNHIVLAGIATSGVILSTVRNAADMDYKITILKDCCIDLDDEVHRVLMEKVFPSQADVVDSSTYNW